MWRLCLTFVDIALHRRGPDVLPASGFLLGLVLVAYFGVECSLITTSTAPFQMLGLLVFDQALFLCVVWGLLVWFGKRHRFMQTATALVGTDAFMALVSVPLVIWSAALDAPPEEATAPRILFLVLLVWSIDVSSYVVSRALSRPYALGVGIVLVYVFGSMALRDALFPVVH